MIGPLPAKQALALFEYCPVPILIRDKKGWVTAYNAALEKLMGISSAQELNQLDPTDSLRHPAGVLLGNGPLISWTDGNAQEHHFTVRDIVLCSNEKIQARLFFDISKTVQLEQSNSKLTEELRQTILTDSATGLLNRRGIILALEPQVARSRRYSSPISVVLLQIDSGEKRADLITEIARLLKDQLRWADIIGCTENHQFILVLPETSAEAALKLVDKLKIQLHRLVETIETDHQVSSCYGISDWRKNDNASTLLKRAELALKEASSNQATSSIAL